MSVKPASVSRSSRAARTGRRLLGFAVATALLAACGGLALMAWNQQENIGRIGERLAAVRPWLAAGRGLAVLAVFAAWRPLMVRLGRRRGLDARRIETLIRLRRPLLAVLLLVELVLIQNRIGAALGWVAGLGDVQFRVLIGGLLGLAALLAGWEPLVRRACARGWLDTTLADPLLRWRWPALATVFAGVIALTAALPHWLS